jgi:membrane protein YqaA with SNARE-associated domain
MSDVSLLVQQFLEWSNGFVEAWGYLGVFVISLIGNASIIFPIPSFIVVFTFASVLNPWLLGLAAGAGATIGELTGYGLGRGGRKVLEERYGKWFTKVEEWAQGRGVFPVVIVFAATPLPSDIMGAFCGMIRYEMRRFLLASFIGKSIMHLAIAWAGFFGMRYILSFFTTGGFLMT